ncbi:MAG TPA: endonuclease MutS2 [Armatimonadota bacterium]|jgi:DNA mismatch repair protein MutS2
MDARTLRVLEYDKALALLGAQAHTGLGRERCLRLRPSTDAGWVAAHLLETSEARELLAAPAVGAPPFGGVTDQHDTLARATARALLLPEELLAVRDLTYACRRLRTYFDRAAEELGEREVINLGQRVETYPEIEAEVSRCLTDTGEVAPDATPELASLLRRHATVRERLRQRMESLAQEYARRGVLQDPLVVERGGRLCLPVLSQFQGRFEGIVHDRSSSGVTLFMEPLAMVPQGNELREAELGIEEEKRRILAMLSDLVGRHAEALRTDLRRITALDFIFAKGRLSQVQDAYAPELSDYVDLPDARHPLLGARAVPIEFRLGREFQTLVVTGPNTGGKTVAIKTVGLLVLLAQSGLHIPAAPSSRLPVFTHIFADIGDEQSLEQSLSTFSSHMTQIVKILHRVQAAARQGQGPLLVLLDEIGAGTDPTEGTALGTAILEALHGAGCLTVVTTHYNELKAFAFNTPGMENASVEFDPKTLEPTYRLLIGQPGSSNAFNVAQRLGLPREIVARARERLGEAGRDFSRALEQVERTQADLTRRRREAETASRETERLRAQHARELDEFHQRRREAMQSGFSEAQAILREAQEKAARIISSLQDQERHTADSERLRGELAAQREAIRAQEKALETEMREAEQAVASPEAPAALREVAAGQRVWVGEWEREATVIAPVGKDRALLAVGSFQVETPLAGLFPMEEKHERPATNVLSLRKQMAVPDEIMLLGKTVAEATQDLDKYLDDAALAGREEVRIVHGKGTGALRKGIQAYLKKHPAVAEFGVAEDSEGGAGATVVRLKG